MTTFVSSCCEGAVERVPERSAYMCRVCGRDCSPVGNTLLRCSTCGDEQRCDYASIAGGEWPDCHGYPLVLVRTSADLAAGGGALHDRARAAARETAR